MKKYWMILTAAALSAAMLLSGCGSDKKDDTKKEEKTEAATTAAVTEAQSGGALSAEDVVFTYNGVSVELNGDAAAAKTALGEPLEEKSQLSCHGQGDDKTYTYNGFVLNTYPLDGQDRVLEIVINTAGIPTSKGVQVGDPVSSVTAAYGDGYREVGMYYAYEAGDGKSLQFFIQNDTVQEISYYYDV